MVSCNCHASRGFSTTARRSIALSVRAALPASCSEEFIFKFLLILSPSLGFFFAFATPWVAHSRSRCERPARLERFVSYVSKSSHACSFAMARSERNVFQPPAVAFAWCVNSSISKTCVMVCSRNVRSWLTRTTPPGMPLTNSSNRASPSRSRSLVGSSRR